MRTLKQTYQIKAHQKLVWQALVDPKVINAWGGGPAKMSAKQGAKFYFWDKSIYGVNIRVEKGKELVQEWYAGKWKEPSYVKFTLKPKKRGLQTKTKGVGTKVKLVHENIPPDLYEELKQGWMHYFFASMKLYLEGKHGNPEVEYHQGG